MFPNSHRTNSFDMAEDIYDAYKKDFQYGNVAVGNVCNANCHFCAYKWNPPDVIKDLKRFLTIKEIKHFTSLYLLKVKSFTSLYTNGGEFFLHPQATEILDFLAAENKLPIDSWIYTNGMNLTPEHIKMIKKLNLTVGLSLNTANINTKQRIMGNSYIQNRNAIDSINTLDKSGINYTVSMVPLQSVLNNGELENTVRYLKKSKVKSIQIHRPGCTKYTPLNIAKELTIPDKELLDFTSSMRQKYRINIDVGFCRRYLNLIIFSMCFMNYLITQII